MRTRSQQALNSDVSSAPPQSKGQESPTNILTTQSSIMPPAASKEARSKRPGPKPEPAEPIKRPKRNPLAKLYKDVAKAFYDFEELQDNTVILGTDLKDANSTIKDEHERNRNLQDEVTHLKAELRKCGRIIKKLSRENDAMKVDVLKQQPMSQAPDSQIADMYRSLQDKISSWIDTEIRTVEDGCVGTNGELNLSLNPSGRASREDASFLAKGFLFGGEYLLESIVQYKLHELLYSEDMMYFALACDDAIFLHSVEEGLPKLDPPRDSSRIQYLRSEILKGYSKSRLFEEICTTTMSVMTEAVLEAVNTILPGGEDDPGRKIRFEEWVLRPAVDLAVGMKTSATSYSFSDRMTHESRLKQLPLSSFAQEGYCMINIDTRETMRANKGIQLESDGVIGHQVLLLAPGLNRCDLGNLVKRLTPDVVCVKVGPVPEQARPHLESTDKASPVHCRAESASSGELECLDTEMEDRGTQSSQRFLTDVKKEEPAEALKHEFGTR